ncbi:MAG: MotA/TolQ/ExbB proton channel family protein [Alphaproteobacteria bacterium]|nr:MAG: MotA/TolQ/ExbB proton channel family protein [Alphaproteobacteria bacterium]
MNTIIRKLGLALSISAACVIAPATGAFAQDTGMTLDQLLERVKQGRVQENTINKQREAEFRSNRNNQAALLAKAEQDVRNEEAESARLEAIVARNKEEIARLSQLLQEALGEFNELVGVVKQVAGDTRGVLNNSLISSEHSDRAAVVAAIAEKETIPTSQDLNDLWATLHGEMTYQGQVSRYTATVASGDGSPEDVDVVRVGPFNAMRSNGDFVKFDEGKLANLGRQPTNSKFNAAAKALFNADAGEVVRGTVDPSQGSILGTFVFTPTLMERVQQGGTVGYVIIALGAIALLLGLARIFALWSTGGAVRRQARNNKASKSNPLGRIMLAYEENRGADVETLELKLDEAVMREVPKLERGLNLLKVIAAVAPMMGLLGTVTGMILTFQAIQLYGAGDPQLMAGGISQALMTTVLGLVVAIPVLLIHSFASGMSTSVTQILEEQSVGIVARHAEGS